MAEDEVQNPEEMDDMTVLFYALKAAHEAFGKCIEDLGFDSAFWQLSPLEGFTLTADFEQFKRIIYDPDYSDRQEKIEDWTKE